MLTAISCSVAGTSLDDLIMVRRLTTLGQDNGSTDFNAALHPTEAGYDGSENTLFFVFVGTDANVIATNHQVKANQGTTGPTIHFPLADNFGGARTNDGNDSVGAVIAQTDWGLENETDIPEIDIKVDSIAVTAVTRKLKAKWTPELVKTSMLTTTSMPRLS